MANELTVSCSLRFSKGDVEESKSYGGVQVDISGTRVIRNVQTIGITEEAIVVGDIGTSGYLIAKNLDSTNYVTIRPGTGTADLVKLKAGEVCMFRLALNGPWALADTAACDVEFMIVSD